MSKLQKSSLIDVPRDAHKGEKDNFGIEPFEKGLTKFILQTNTPITIALQGEWGSGKTSLMNSLKKNLSVDKDAPYHSIWLNTWEYALMQNSTSTLIDIMTKLIEEITLIAKADETQTQKLVSKIKRWGNIAGKFFAKAAVETVATGSGELVDKLLESGQSTIGEIRDDLEAIIEASVDKDNKQGFLFFIDDLDRIDPPVAVELLELLKNIFTLNHCVFILSIDYDVVIKGLEPKFGKLSVSNEREFRSFFDKIIQVPFSMPVSSYKIDNFLKDSLLSTNYLQESHIQNIKLIEKFSEICSLTVGSNPRALKRLLNSLLLISCINQAKDNNAETEHLSNDLDLLINFTLVSIQIAYPPVYRLLVLYPGFDKWNEAVALQMNLKELDQQSIDKLNSTEEFDEEWEKVLFRLCENDYYLKKKALQISRLLNSLKSYIVEKEHHESIEELISSIISLSSVTNLDAVEKPAEDYHKGNFLKHLRWKLLPFLKQKLPDIADSISEQGKRVQTNAYIKFTPNDWGCWLQLSSHLYHGKVRLIIATSVWSTKADKDLKVNLKEQGLLEEFEKIELGFNQITNGYPTNFEAAKLSDYVGIKEEYYLISLHGYCILPNIDAFSLEDNLDKLSDFIVDFYGYIIQLRELYDRYAKAIEE